MWVLLLLGYPYCTPQPTHAHLCEKAPVGSHPWAEVGSLHIAPCTNTSREDAWLGLSRGCGLAEATSGSARPGFDSFFFPLQIFMCLLYFSSWLLCFKRLFVIPWLLFNHADGHHLYHDEFWENTLGHFWVFYSYTLLILPFLPSSLLFRPPCKGQAVWTPTSRLSETIIGVESD